MGAEVVTVRWRNGSPHLDATKVFFFAHDSEATRQYHYEPGEKIARSKRLC
jgi:hypothetical protein